ncbi:hypothetical protein CH267_04590 [Rhodococcus sp. 06-621-2]|nr:type II toxin-antitoxin system RelE/ParE family toxin [Rhodococcus sp. 06-621-2]OZC60231.1 hypothetical protein CH267_04590 [Rhodococcus sp. 06-621-2]
MTARWFWFDTSPNTRCITFEEFCDLPIAAQAVLTVAAERLLDNQSRGNSVKRIDEDLYELRCRHLNNQYRIIFIRWGPHYVGLVAFMKNQQKLPTRYTGRARKRMKAWRLGHGATPAAELPSRSPTMGRTLDKEFP